MKRALAVVACAGLLLGLFPMAGSAAAPTVKFGMEAGSIMPQANAGVKPDYGTFWIGPWTLSGGWSGPDSQLTAMRNQGVTPAVHFYYWGDDISPSCVENGCWSSLHNANKNRAGWQQLAQQMTDHFNSRMGGKPVLVFLESEFNKGGIETYEPFDGYMANMAAFIHAKYPAAQIVLGFGNWGSQHWGNFDRAAAASDMVGVQGMRGSTRQAKIDMYTLYDGLLAGAKTLNAKFPGKPLMLTDIAVSSYPEPEYRQVQADVLREVFANLATLKAHGVRAIVYRSWYDSPGMNTANYYGMAERYWGLASSSGLKPAAQVWINGVKAERAGGASAPPPPPAPGPFSATFAVSPNVNEWWVQVDVKSASTVSSVTAMVNGGAPHNLPKTSWGAYAASFNVPKGSTVVFTATDPNGATARSEPVQWMGSASAPPSPSPPSFSATFSVPANVNEWWVEVAVRSAGSVAGVTATVNGGSPRVLPKTSWGTYAASFNVPKGSTVVFTATDPNGATAKSAPVQWMGAASPSPFTAKFTPKTLENHWWVETAVSSDAAIGKVEVRLNNGPWTELPKTSWGTYAKSLNVPAGTQLAFRATSTTGATALSPTFLER